MPDRQAKHFKTAFGLAPRDRSVKPDAGLPPPSSSRLQTQVAVDSIAPPKAARRPRRAYGFSAMHPSATRRASAWPGRASGSRPGISLWWSLGRSAADYFGNLIAVAAPKPGHVRLVPEGPLAGRRLIPQVDQHEPRRIIHASGVAHTATEHSIPSCQQMTHGGAGTCPTRQKDVGGAVPYPPADGWWGLWLARLGLV